MKHLDLRVLDSRRCAGRSEHCEVVELRAGRVALVHAVAVAGRDVSAQRLADLSMVLHSVLAFAPHDARTCAYEVNGLLHTAPSRGPYPISEHAGFITMFLGIYEDATRSLDYVNCGHGSHLLLRRDGLVERLLGTGIPLGMVAHVSFESASIRLAPGDTLVVHGAEMEAEFEEWAPLESLRTGSSIRTLGEMQLDLVAEEVLRRVRSLQPGEPTDDMAILVARGK